MIKNASEVGLLTVLCEIVQHPYTICDDLFILCSLKPFHYRMQ